MVFYNFVDSSDVFFSISFLKSLQLAPLFSPISGGDLIQVNSSPALHSVMVYEYEGVKILLNCNYNFPFDKEGYCEFKGYCVFTNEVVSYDCTYFDIPF